MFNSAQTQPFIDKVQVARSTSNGELVLIISGKRYLYENVPAQFLDTYITSLKRMKNKGLASSKVSVTIKNLEKNRVKEEEKPDGLV